MESGKMIENIDQNTTCKKKKINGMIPSDNSIILIDYRLVQSSSWRFHLATDRNRCRISQPNIGQSSGSPAEVPFVELAEVRGSITPKGNPQNQVIRAYWGSQRLKQQPRILCGSDLGPLDKCYGCIAWCSCGTHINVNRSVFGFLP
jgi:hypothetical protein